MVNTRPLFVGFGFLVVSDGIAIGPFATPEGALAWAIKNKPENFKLMQLIDPELVDEVKKEIRRRV